MFARERGQVPLQRSMCRGYRGFVAPLRSIAAGHDRPRRLERGGEPGRVTAKPCFILWSPLDTVDAEMVLALSSSQPSMEGLTHPRENHPGQLSETVGRQIPELMERRAWWRG